MNDRGAPGLFGSPRWASEAARSGRKITRRSSGVDGGDGRDRGLAIRPVTSAKRLASKRTDAAPMARDLGESSLTTRPGLAADCAHTAPQLEEQNLPVTAGRRLGTSDRGAYAFEKIAGQVGREA